MPEEENPFLVTPKKAHPEEKVEKFGTEETVSFMVDPNEEKKKSGPIVTSVEKPHWESSGTPIWDKKTNKPEDEEYDVVDHN